MNLNWLGTLDWGNVPAWVGAFLTSGSLFLALNIMRTDRRRIARSAADKLVAAYDFELENWNADKSLILRLRIHLFNGNDVPVYSVGISGISDGAYSWKRIGLAKAESHPSDPYSFPSKVEITSIHYNIKWGHQKLFYVSITDSHGRTWRRRLDGKYISELHARWNQSRLMNLADSIQLGPEWDQ
jgi:hypothetical protein